LDAERIPTMTRLVRGLRILLPVLLACSTLAADPGEIPGRAPHSGIALDAGITPAEAVFLALKENAGLRALRAAREVASAGVGKAGALPDPELRFGWTGFDDTAGRNNDRDVAVRWSPPRPGERELKISLARERVSEADAEIRGAEERLAADVRYLHARIVFLDEQIVSASEAVKLRERIVRTVDSQVQADLRTLSDRNVADLALADALFVPGILRTDREVCLHRLAMELNLPPTQNLRVRPIGDPFSLQPRELDPAALAEKALSRRPELSVAAARIARAEQALALGAKERYPWISYVQMGRQFETRSGSDSWGWRIGVDLPVFKWTRSSLDEPAAVREHLRQELEAARLRVRLQVGQVVAQLRGKYEELAQLRGLVTTLADRDVSLSEAAVAAGRIDEVQHLAALARRLQRRQTYLSSLLDCRRLEIELDWAAGAAITQ
jgi:outer membrane protein TolC